MSEHGRFLILIKFFYPRYLQKRPRNCSWVCFEKINNDLATLEPLALLSSFNSCVLHKTATVPSAVPTASVFGGGVIMNKLRCFNTYLSKSNREVKLSYSILTVTGRIRSRFIQKNGLLPNKSVLSSTTGVSDCDMRLPV